MRHTPALSRRAWLNDAGLGLGGIALDSLLRRDLSAAPRGVRPTPRPAQRVIFLFMGGGPSHVDLWDPKPLLKELHGKDVPASIAREVPAIARSPLGNLAASPFSFARHGQSGIEVSELLPETARRIDDLCVIRSLQHNTPIHAPAEYLTTTGSIVGDRPSLGAWVTYGLGSDNRDLPEFIVLNSEGTPRPPAWAAGFLPARHQGTVAPSGSGLPNLALPPGMNATARRAQLDLIERLHRLHAERLPADSELEARIQSYELAFRMQTAAPEAFELAGETAETRALYGLDAAETAEFGRHCLLARRLVERGVRFVQLRAGKWDSHSKLVAEHRARCRATDRPIAALLADLKRRGLLESTLVIWGGEFGRTPATQVGTSGQDWGRDHSPSGYTIWLAGGGVRGGQVIGATDPVGYAACERPIPPRDVHATILAALGVEQRELFYDHLGRREILTVNGGDVVPEVFGS